MQGKPSPPTSQPFSDFSLSQLDAYIDQTFHSNVVYCDLPFRHWIIDEFLPETLATSLLDAFPNSKHDCWDNYNYEMQRKSASNHFVTLPLPIQSFIAYLSNISFVSKLETLTSIQPLLADPSLDGGGLHQIFRGGSLAVHADFSRHKKYDITRRLNLIYYLNRDWQVSFRGSLCLYDSTGTIVQKEISPIFNRLIIFETTNTSFHGHPEPLSSPSSISRKSIALYYYTSKPHHSCSGINTRWRRPMMRKPRFLFIRKSVSLCIWHLVCLSQYLQDCLKHIHDQVDPW